LKKYRHYSSIRSEKMTDSLVNSDDVVYFAKRLSESGTMFSQDEIHDVVGQVAEPIKSFFLPIPPPLALGSIEVDYDGQNNRILACHQSSPDAAPQDADVVATVPQPVPLKKKRPILRTSTTPPRAASPKRVRNKGFWRKNRATSTSVTAF
jgi:hypothetical protein